MLYFKLGQIFRFSYYIIPLILLFYIGGIVQYLGLISPTQTNILIIVLLLPLFLHKSIFRFILKEYLLVFFCLYSILVGLFLSVDFLKINTYIYYIYCVFVASIFSRFLSDYFVKRNGINCAVEFFFRFAKFFIIVQLFTSFFQNLFIDYVVAYAPFNIIKEDAVFGTMYLKSDASLAAIIQIIMISFFIFRRSIGEKLVYSSLSVGLIFLGGSKAAQSVIGFVFLLLWLNDLYNFLRMKKYGFNYLIVVSSSIVLTCLAVAFGANFYKSFYDYTVNAYHSRHSWYSADRLAPFGQFFSEKVNLWGNGQLTYYNPMTQEWLYDSGFSTYYSLYIDLGLVGLIFYLVYYTSRIYSSTRNFFIFSLILLVLMVYSAFSFTLSDLSFVFVFNYMLYLYCLYNKSFLDKGLSQ